MLDSLALSGERFDFDPRPPFDPRWIPLSATSTSSFSSTKTLFINPVKLSTEASRYLHGLGIAVRRYEDVWDFLQQVGKSLQISTEEKESRKKVVLTGQSVTWKAQLAVGKVRSSLGFESLTNASS